MTRREILYAASNMKHIRDFHLPYIAELSQRGDHVTVLSHGAGADVDLPMTKRMLSAANLRCIGNAARLFRRNHYDLIVLNTSLAAFVLRAGLLLSFTKQGKVVNIVHGYLFDRKTNPVRRALMILAEKLLVGVTDTVAVMNAYDQEIARRHGLVKRGGDIVMTRGMGVDLSRFSPCSGEEKSALRAESPFTDEDIVLVCVGEFTKRKNQLFLIEAFSTLKARVPRVKMLFAGDGALFSAAKSRAKALDVSGDIWFAGHRADVEKLYRMSDICVTASKSEGLPFNVMEAMACGLPILASEIKGHSDLLRGGVGVLFALDDREAYLTEAVRLLTCDQARIALGANAREAMRKYRFEEAKRDILALIADKAE